MGISKNITSLHVFCEHQVLPYVVLDLPASVGVDGQPSLLILRFHIWVLRCESILYLQASSDTGHLCVSWVGQHLRQLHQEPRL